MHRVFGSITRIDSIENGIHLSSLKFNALCR